MGRFGFSRVFVGVCGVTILITAAHILNTWNVYPYIGQSEFTRNGANILQLLAQTGIAEHKTLYPESNSANTYKEKHENTKQETLLITADNANTVYNNIDHVIVVFNPAEWVPIDVFNSILSNQCYYKNCRMTSDTTNMAAQSAIVYIIVAGPALPEIPPIPPANRNPDQAWIFTWLESPVHHVDLLEYGRTVYQNDAWRNTVNWTMTYTLDADIFFPYGTVKHRSERCKSCSARDYSAIFHRKRKHAAWVVSNCDTQGKREIYVEQLRKYGVDVDVYGECAGSRFKNWTELIEIIERDYLFYLAFENSLCKDYITDKFFVYGKLDVVLIVRGAGKYSNLLPSNAYINTADFLSAHMLAKYLLTVASDEALYTDYLRNKDQFIIDEYVGRYDGACRLCEKLNNLESNKRIYTDLVDRVTKRTCFDPTDINEQ